MCHDAPLQRHILLLHLDHEIPDSYHFFGQSLQAIPWRILQVTTLSLLSLRQTCGWSSTTLESSTLPAQMCLSWLVMSRWAPHPAHAAATLSCRPLPARHDADAQSHCENRMIHPDLSGTSKTSDAHGSGHCAWASALCTLPAQQSPVALTRQPALAFASILRSSSLTLPCRPNLRSGGRR